MAAETKTGFMIDDVLYPFPEGMTVDEYRIIYKYSGLTGRDLTVGDDTLLQNPDCLASLLHVVYRREHPDATYDDIAEVVGKQDVAAALEHLFDRDEDDALPPASTTEPEPSSPKNSVEKSDPSGTDLRRSSDAPVVHLAPTTTPGSGTSPIHSPKAESAA